VSERTHRRQLTEHIDGIARFRWQQGDATRLIGALRDDVLNACAIKSRDCAELSELARSAGMTTMVVQHVLFDDLTDSPKEFTDAVKSLQRLRQQL